MKILEEAKMFLESGVAGPELSSYVAPSITHAAYLVMGIHPRRLAPELTVREACAWARQAEHPSPLEWLKHKVGERYHELKNINTSFFEVVRWAEIVCSNEELRASANRHRSLLGEDQASGSVWDRIDEVAPCDLTRSPWKTIYNAVQRNISNMWDGPDQLIPEPDFTHLEIELITTFSRLYLEGVNMSHCIANYANKISSRKGYAFSINANGHNSTAWYSGGRVTEHKGKANSSPHQECVSLEPAITQYVQRYEDSLRNLSGSFHREMELSET